MCLLFDYYGDLLTDKQKDIFDYYYNEDLSLAEIAELLNITRQGVRDSLVRSEAIMREFEEKCGFITRFGDINATLGRIAELADKIIAENLKGQISLEIDRMAGEIYSLVTGMNN
jgi:predicted DNA-binding protein YlxM (UPF0122 family)